ncbi:YdcF family protein [Billgrantia endophytica]|uniref:YdcF family protein n=1 Tax=Billgrantia endophytica TaxID=2033802 RepID=A0A2N7U364_9GAMM|nr:YdcF family protein [Halomonas endophytica]PMR74860.1 YdcF family protein [Halomonas endophytica]
MSVLKALLLPPTLNVLLILLGLMLGLRRLAGALLMLLGLAGLLALSTPLASHALRQGLEPYPVPIPSQLETAQAIVILGGGRDYDAPEFGWGDAPADATWRRLAYGAHLHRQTDLPILVSGGRRHDEHLAEASLMAAALRDVFAVPVRWLEEESRNTMENARFSAGMLLAADITHVALVSQAWHLPRAVAEFEAAGLTVVPAPTDFASPPPRGLRAWIPRSYHLNQSTRALNEWLGRAEIALRDRLPL